MGSSVIIVGGGYSVNDGISLGLWDKIKGKEIWSLNSVYKAMPYLPTKQLWVDPDFFDADVDGLQKLWEQGVGLISRNQPRVAGLKDKIEVYHTTNIPEEYLGREAINKNKVFRGRRNLCGMFALSIAIAKGYSEIFLLGYDFGTKKLEQKNTHWYQERIPELNIYSTGAGRPEVYLNNAEGIHKGQVWSEVEDFALYSKETDPSMIIWNVSLESNINYFPKISYEQFFDKIR